MNIGWPEGIILTLYAINLLITAAADGKPRTGKNSFAMTLCMTALGLGILYWGGFFA